MYAKTYSAKEADFFLTALRKYYPDRNFLLLRYHDCEASREKDADLDRFSSLAYKD